MKLLNAEFVMGLLLELNDKVFVGLTNHTHRPSARCEHSRDFPGARLAKA